MFFFFFLIYRGSDTPSKMQEGFVQNATFRCYLLFTLQSAVEHGHLRSLLQQLFIQAVEFLLLMTRLFVRE